MSDPTDATPDRSEPVVPEAYAIQPPGSDDDAARGPIGDETARIPVEPEVAWTAPGAGDTPDAPRAMPWEAPAGAAAVPHTPPLAPAREAADPGSGPAGDPATSPTGVLSAATVGWVTPPPEPVATGKPGWVIAGVGPRLGAWILDGIFGFILILVGAVVLGIVAAIISPDNATLPEWVYLLAVLGFYFVYFVGSWTSKGKATPGMRLFKLQVANASDGKRLEIGPAVTRWLALGYAFSLVGLIPVLSGLASLATLIWSIVLLITTNQDKMHQGLHDRWGKSVVVRPEGAAAGRGAAVACLIIALILVLFVLASIVGLIFLGGQMSTILSAVGDSI